MIVGLKEKAGKPRLAKLLILFRTRPRTLMLLKKRALNL